MERYARVLMMMIDRLDRIHAAWAGELHQISQKVTDDEWS